MAAAVHLLCSSPSALHAHDALYVLSAVFSQFLRFANIVPNYIHSTCEIEAFVETHLSLQAVCDTPIARIASLGACPLSTDLIMRVYVRTTPTTQLQHLVPPFPHLTNSGVLTTCSGCCLECCLHCRAKHVDVANTDRNAHAV